MTRMVVDEDEMGNAERTLLCPARDGIYKPKMRLSLLMKKSLPSGLR